MPAIDSDWLHLQDGARRRHNSIVCARGTMQTLRFSPPPIKVKEKLRVWVHADYYRAHGHFDYQSVSGTLWVRTEVG